MANHRIQKNIDKDGSNKRDGTGRNDIENFAEYSANGKKDDQVFSFSSEIGEDLGFCVKSSRMLGIGHDAIGLMELVKADGIDRHHDGIRNHGTKQVTVHFLQKHVGNKKCT